MNSNQRANQAAIKQFRKELEAMVDDIKEVDKVVLNRAMGEGLRAVKPLTPVGVYPSHVSFDTADGKHVEFDVIKRTGGALRREWRRTRVFKSGNGVKAKLYNNVEYASYVNYGHRIVNKSGETIGWVNGKFFLEKAIYKIDKAIEREFRREVERVNRIHGSRS